MKPMFTNLMHARNIHPPHTLAHTHTHPRACDVQEGGEGREHRPVVVQHDRDQLKAHAARNAAAALEVTARLARRERTEVLHAQYTVRVGPQTCSTDVKGTS